MFILLALIAIPPLCGILIFSIADFRFRKPVVLISTVLQALLALVVALNPRYFGEFGKTGAEWIDYATTGLELAMAALVIMLAVRKHRPLTLILGMIQGALTIYASTSGKAGNEGTGFVPLFKGDQVSLLMVFIVGIVGGLILLHAAGYMKTYQDEHRDVRDRRRFFFLTVFIFVGAMYGLVLSDDLRLVLLFWEVTTLCSFFLIGYAGNPESEKSAYRALSMNLSGGIAFSIAILLLESRGVPLSLSRIGAGAFGRADLAALAVPAALLAFAGIVKSAQIPFTPWLLGAMVAPTPVSALLHSSTMVKAGVYLLLRLAPLISGSVTGYAIAFIGAATFLTGSFAAISCRNAKRILAFSTVANLGLIVTCAGFGTYQLAWVAFFLILFHAIAKSLLFLATGTASIGLGGSLDIEDMGGLVQSMPRVSMMLIVGISAMFIAPFGMLVSKWAAMEAFITMNSIASPIIIVILAYGSSATVFFWTKWLAILVRVPNPLARRGELESKLSREELITGGSLAVLAIAACALFPLVSARVVEPYLFSTYGYSFGLDRENILVTLLMIAMTVAVPSLLIAIATRKKHRLSPAYMMGRTADADLAFKGSKGVTTRLELRSYYLERYFSEPIVMSVGIGVGILFVIILLGTALL